MTNIYVILQFHQQLQVRFNDVENYKLNVGKRTVRLLIMGI